MTNDKVNLCGCPCSAQDPFRCPSFMTLWECHLCKSQGYYLPGCHPFSRFPTRSKYFRWSPRDGCKDPEEIERSLKSCVESKRPQSKEAILERAKASRARASELKESAKKALERARLYEKKAKKAPKFEPYQPRAWVCKVSDGR